MSTPKRSLKANIQRLKFADARLSRIHLPKRVDLSEQSPFDVPVVNCAQCGNDGVLEAHGEQWDVSCTNIHCANAIQHTSNFAWKAKLLWMQRNAKAIDYQTYPFFDLVGLRKAQARQKLKHIDNYVRMNKQKSESIAQSKIKPNNIGLVYDHSYWEALYFWVLCAKASVSQYRPPNR